MAEDNISKQVNDSLTNLTTGLGTDRDKSIYTRFADLVPLDDAQIAAAYRSDWIARKIVDIPAHDATRRWRSWQAEGDQIELIEAEEKRLGLRRKIRAAMKMGRLYGGGALILGVQNGNPDQPINLGGGFSKGSLKYVHAVSRRQLTAGDLETDITSENFGRPQFYTIPSTSAGQVVKIHHSRVARFIGNELPDSDAPQANTGWGDSVLQSVEEAVKNAGGASSGIASLIHEAKIDVIKLPGLMEKVRDPAYRDKVLERYRLANVSKSFINALLLDAEETWERIEVNFAGLPDVLRLYLLIASGAADIPATRMLGQSPAGMNATGDSDLRNYYDRIESDQEDELSPAIATLDEVLIWSALGGRDPNIYYEWNELWQMDDAQRADIAVKKSQVHQIDAGLGLIDPEALRIARENQLVEDGFYPGFEAALEEAKKLAAEADVPEDDPEAAAQFAAQRAAAGGDPTKKEMKLQLVRTDAFDADGDDADFNFVGEDGSFSGYAVRWSATYHDGFRVAPGAFRKAIEDSNGKLRILYQHKTDQVIGMAEILEDSTGLRIIGQLNMDLALAREVKSNIQKNILNGLSIGYDVYRADPGDKKLMVEIPVMEVSVVTFPSMEEATIDAADSEPRTLYVRRNVLNGDDIIKWARGQGLEDLVPKEELHVTIVYTRNLVNWMKMGEPYYGDENGNITIPPGGPRSVEILGPDDDRVVAIEFLSSILCYRHEEMIRNGATHSYPEYRPHITVAKVGDVGGTGISLTPYRGKIVLGPEIFSEIDQVTGYSVKEKKK